MEHYGDLPKSESWAQLNSSSGSWLTDRLVEFPPLGSEDLIQLREDFLRVYPIYCKHRNYTWSDKYITSISDAIPRDKATYLSSEEATALTTMLRKVPLLRQIISQLLTSLADRPYLYGLAQVSVRTRGRDF